MQLLCRPYHFSWKLIAERLQRKLLINGQTQICKNLMPLRFSTSSIAADMRIVQGMDVMELMHIWDTVLCKKLDKERHPEKRPL